MNSSTSTSDRASLAWWLLPLLCALLLPAYNWVQDYYGIFGQRTDWRGVIPNERYAKLEAVLERRDEIRILLFGSSKAANIPFTRNLGEGAYNLAYSEGLPRDHLEVLEYLVDELPALERVYIAVDEMSYLLDPSGHRGDYLRRQHPAVAGIPDWRFLLSYLFRPLSNTDALYFDPERQSRPQITYQFQSTGRSLCPSCEAEIDADPQAHAGQPFFRFPYNPPDQYGIPRLREDLVAIIALLEERGIEPVLFLQPTYLNNLRWHNLGMLEVLKAMLVELGPFYDFLTADPEMGDAAKFYDVIHFRPLVGQRMMEYLLGERTAEPGEFGFRVVTDTLAAHSNIIRASLERTWMSPMKSPRDLEYSQWQAANNFPRQPLQDASASELLAHSATPVSCRLDSVNRGRFRGDPVRIAEKDLGMLELEGWAELAGMQFTAYLTLQERGPFGVQRAYPLAAGLRRQDVANRFGADFTQVGYRGNLDISGLRRGNYRLDLRFSDSNGHWFACDNAFRLVVL